MTKADLRTGMFGLVSDSFGEQLFVIVGDKLIYESGGFDNISDLQDDLAFDYSQIEALVDANSFDHARSSLRLCDESTLIWKRGSKSEDEEVKIEFDEMGELTFTIYKSYLKAGFTEEQAFELTKKSFESALAQSAVQNLFGGLVK